MNGSTASLRIENTSFPTSTTNTASTDTQTLKFAILIILSIGGFLAAGSGICGYSQIGLFSRMGEINSIIAMVVGGGIGILLLTAGIRFAKEHRKTSITNPPDHGPTSNFTKGEILPLNRGNMKQISLNTQQLMEQGYYTNSKFEKIPLQSAVDLEDKTRIFKFEQQMQSVQSIYDQKVCVIENDCLDVAREFVERGNKVAVVLFAGPEEVGGGFIDGSGAGQEERIIIRSDLAALMKYYHEEQILDPENFNITRFPLFTSLIHTTEVNVFRDSSFAALDCPFQVGILITAAPVSNEYLPTTNSFDLQFTPEGEPDYALEETRTLMKAIIFTQLKTAYDCGYETLILGAFGCGAFKNPAAIVAGIYKEIIETYFEGAFKHIAFAIIDGPPGKSNPKGNVHPFKSCFPHDLV